MMFMCIIYLSLNIFTCYCLLKIKRSLFLFIRGLILFTKVNKKQSIFTYQLMIVYAHEHLMTHLHRIYIMIFFPFFIVYVCMSNYH